MSLRPFGWVVGSAETNFATTEEIKGSTQIAVKGLMVEKAAEKGKNNCIL